MFNFSEEDFVVNMGDKIARLSFEEIKIPAIKETDSLEGTGRGGKGYGSTRINSGQSTQDQDDNPKAQIQFQKTGDDKTQTTNGVIPINKYKRSQLEMARHIISASQLQKLAKNDAPVFLAIVRATEPPNK